MFQSQVCTTHVVDACCDSAKLVLLQNILPAKTYNAAKTLALTAGVVGLGIVMVLLTGYVMASPTFGWTGMPICQPPMHCRYSSG